MKWENKGCEFDSDAEKIIQNFKDHGEKIYLFGAGKIGREMAPAMKRYRVIGGFIDNSPEKQNGSLFDETIMSLEQYLEKKDRGWIIVTVAGNRGNDIVDQLLNCGLKKGIDFFSREQFTTYVFPILSFYQFKKLYVDIAQISLTERCTLKCRNCAHGCYAVKADSRDMDIEQVYASADHFFRYVDCVREFVLIGGEPLLYQRLADVIQYVGEKYRDKMVCFSITSNGTIMPEQDVIEMCRKYRVLFRVSNYSSTISRLKEKYEKLQKLLEDNDVECSLGAPEREWMDYGFETVCRENQEKELIAVFDACKTPCREIRGDRYYYCVMARSVSENLKLNIGEDDYLDLKKIKDRKSFFEFDMGCSEKGYLEMCRHCNGAEAVNYPIPAAKQAEIL